MSISDRVWASHPPRPYAEARDMVRDADLLLCSATDAGSSVISWATKSPWSHVAMAFHLQDVDRVLVLECVERIGVRAVPLSDFIRRTRSGEEPYPGRILLARHRQLSEGIDRERLREMMQFAFTRLGDKFSHSETAKIGLRILLGRLNIATPRIVAAADEFICSEYVARCFEHIGLPIPWDGRGFIAPAEFAADPQIAPVAQIDTRAVG